MNAYVNVSSQSAQRYLPASVPQGTRLAKVCTWRASSQDELDEGLVMTNEILGEPGALEEIQAALAELDRGEGVEGIEAIRALLTRGE